MDLGEHALVGLARPERLFQVAAPGLGSSFPPLRPVGPGRQPRRAGDEFRGPRRGSGAPGGRVAGAADGHADRGGRGGQDPPGDGGGLGGGGRVPRRGVVVRAGPGGGPDAVAHAVAATLSSAARRACRCWTAWWTR